MKRIIPAVIIILFIIACHQSNNKKAEKKPLTFAELTDKFAAMKLPYKLPDDSIKASENDSLALSPAIIKQFFPDTLTKGDLKKGSNYKLFPKVWGKQDDLSYLIVKASSHRDVLVYLCLFNKKGKYLNRLLLGAKNVAKKGDISNASIDDRYNIGVNHQFNGKSGQTFFKDDVYAANPDGSFSLIVTNSNIPQHPDQLFNPIDTLSQKHKYTGDYTSGKENLVSVRDGKREGEMRFFIHVSKDNSECSGEVDGVGRWISKNVAEYHQEAGPCGIRFTFSSSHVVIKEIGGCGAFRGIRCTFDGSYPRKREKKKK